MGRLTVSTLTTDAPVAEFVRSLERGLAVIRTFDGAHPRLSLSEAARRAGLTRATARRILHTLTTLGYVSTDGKWFELTPRVLDLGYAYLSSLQVGDLAQPAMEALSERLEESVSVGVLEGLDVVYVARIPTKRIMRMAIGLGSRLPALSTSLGRVLLADLPEAARRQVVGDAVAAPSQGFATPRRTVPQVLALLDQVNAQGYALVDQELEEGIRSISAPLRDRSGRAIAAMNVSTTVARVSMERLVGELVPALLDTAATVSALLAKR